MAASLVKDLIQTGVECYSCGKPISNAKEGKSLGIPRQCDNCMNGYTEDEHVSYGRDS